MGEKTAAELLDEMRTDAEKWAKEFTNTFRGEVVSDNGQIASVDQGTLIGWFANAIEAGRSAQYSHSLNAIAVEVNEVAQGHGWWDNDRQLDGVLMLIVSEASEALEEWRNGREPGEQYYTIPRYRPAIEALPEELREFASYLEKTHHGTDPVETYELTDEQQEALVREGFLKPEGVPSELADIVIRVMDAAVEYGIDLNDEVELKLAYNRTRPHRHGGKRS